MARDRSHVSLVRAFLDREGWEVDVGEQTSQATLLTAQKRSTDETAVVVVPTSGTSTTVGHVESAYKIASQRGADFAYVASNGELTDDARDTLQSSAVQHLPPERLEQAKTAVQANGGTPETRAVTRRRLAVVGVGAVGAGVVGSMVLPSGDGGSSGSGATGPSTPTATDASRSRTGTETTTADNTPTRSPADTATASPTPESTASPESTTTPESTASPESTATESTTTPETTVTTVEIVLDGAPDGLQKYSLTLSTSGEGTISDIAPDLISGNQFQVTDGGVGASAVVVRGADLVGSVGETTESQTLLTVTFESAVPAGAVTGTVTELVDDNGEPFDTDRVAFQTA